jgi:hypothetical protein
MTTIEDLKNKIDEINKLVNEKIVSDVEDTYPITDGIIDIEKYFNAKYKILWILKEPYDEFDDEGKPFGGGWGLDEAIRPKQSIHEFTGGRPTFKPMIYTSWGILNDFCLWDDMDNVERAPTMLDALKSIAYINVKKLPGYTTSHHTVIEYAYHQHKEILLKQIEYYNPDIIIGGSTLYNFYQDLGISRELLQSNDSVNYIIKDNKIFIEAYHPAQRSGTTGVSQEKYCNDIINSVKIWATNNTENVL